jgi:hypothetical protein
VEFADLLGKLVVAFPNRLLYPFTVKNDKSYYMLFDNYLDFRKFFTKRMKLSKGLCCKEVTLIPICPHLLPEVIGDANIRGMDFHHVVRTGQGFIETALRLPRK